MFFKILTVFFRVQFRIILNFQGILTTCFLVLEKTTMCRNTSFFLSPLHFRVTIFTSYFEIAFCIRGNSWKYRRYGKCFVWGCLYFFCQTYTKLSINKVKIWLSANQFTSCIKQTQKHISGWGITLTTTNTMWYPWHIYPPRISQLNNNTNSFCEDIAYKTFQLYYFPRK